MHNVRWGRLVISWSYRRNDERHVYGLAIGRHFTLRIGHGFEWLALEQDGHGEVMSSAGFFGPGASDKARKWCEGRMVRDDHDD